MTTYKVMDLKHFIHLECVRIENNRTSNPYRLYLIYSGKTDYGYYTKRRKQIAAYSDMVSVLCMIKDMYAANIQYQPIDGIIAWCKQYYGK